MYVGAAPRQEIKVRFGYPMRKWQRECAAMSRALRFFVLVLHRRAGKTELALKKLLDSAVKCKKPNPHFAYLAPFRNQAKTLVWERLKQMVKVLVDTGHAVINETDLYVRFLHNNAIVRLGGADKPDVWRGVTLDGAILDEPGQMKREVWEEVIRPALSDRRGWAWFTGTPKGINFFSYLFFTLAELAEWGRALYTVYQTDALPPAEIEALKAEQSEQSFAREQLCDFAASGDEQLMSLTDVTVAAQRVYQEDHVAHAPLIFGVDPARFGNDRAVLFPRRGLQAFTPDIWRGLNTMDLASRIGRRIDEDHPDAVFVDLGGMGAGVVDRLLQLGYDQVTGVNFGGKPIDATYLNKRTEMWYLMKQSVEAGLAIPDDNDLKLEMATPTYYFTPANKIAMESKDDIKKRMHKSPDLGDGLALTFAMPVMPLSMDFRLKLKHQKNTRQDYDPYQFANDEGYRFRA